MERDLLKLKFHYDNRSSRMEILLWKEILENANSIILWKGVFENENSTLQMIHERISSSIIFRVEGTKIRIRRRVKGQATNQRSHDETFPAEAIDQGTLNPNGTVHQYYLYTVNDFRLFDQLGTL